MSYQKALIIHLLDFSFLKLLPNIFHYYSEENERGFLGQLTNNISWKNTLRVKIMRTLPSFDWATSQMDKLTNNNNYFFFHSFITHSPFIFKEDCSVGVIDQKSFDKESTKNKHLKCAMKKLKVFLQKLQKLSFYKNIKIIIHSDHGHYGKKGRAFFIYKKRRDDNKFRINYSAQRINDIHYYILDEKNIDKIYNLPKEMSEKVVYHEVYNDYFNNNKYRHIDIAEELYSKKILAEIEEFVKKLK